MLFKGTHLSPCIIGLVSYCGIQDHFCTFSKSSVLKLLKLAKM